MSAVGAAEYFQPATFGAAGFPLKGALKGAGITVLFGIAFACIAKGFLRLAGHGTRQVVLWRKPRWHYKDFIVRLNADCVTPSRLAARVKLRSKAIAAKMARSAK